MLRAAGQASEGKSLAVPDGGARRRSLSVFVELRSYSPLSLPAVRIALNTPRSDQRPIDRSQLGFTYGKYGMTNWCSAKSLYLLLRVGERFCRTQDIVLLTSGKAYQCPKEFSKTRVYARDDEQECKPRFDNEYELQIHTHGTSIKYDLLASTWQFDIIRQ